MKDEGLGGDGYDDVMAGIQAICDNSNENPVLDKKYVFEYPLTWVLDDGEVDTHPFYYGVIQLKFRTNSMMRIGGNIHEEFQK